MKNSPKAYLSLNKQQQSVKKIMLWVVGFVVVVLVVQHVYRWFAVWDAMTPTDDHSWYNGLLYPFTPTVSDENAYQAMVTHQPITFIDVRPSDEYVLGHIPVAINIPEDTLHTVISQQFPDKTTVIFMNCNTGHMGAVSTRLLRSMGYTNVWNIADGLDGWKSHDYPVAH